MLGVASHFNAANLKSIAPKQPGKSAKSKYCSKSGQGTDSKDKSNTDSSYMPEGFPDDICYSYNYKACSGKCSKKHVCCLSKGDHQAKQCTKQE